MISSIKADGLLVYSPANRRYLSGFTGSTGYVIIGERDAGFVTDFRYVNQAGMECTGFEIIENKTPLSDYLSEVINRYGIKKLAYEDTFMTVGFYNNLKEKLYELYKEKDQFESEYEKAFILWEELQK